MAIKRILALSTSPCSREKRRELPPSKGEFKGDGLFGNIAF
jgi:hypothetical protein